MEAKLDGVSQTPRAAIMVRYAISPHLRDWELPEGIVPESGVHDRAAHQLVLLLEEWRERTTQDVQIARNLAIRWIERLPKVGIDPDVCVLRPPPPEGTRVESLKLWRPGHQPPPLCFEIVSKNHPHKDYAEIHERYAAIGADEVVVYDPLLAGPKALGGPVSLQVWRRDPSGVLDRVYMGPGPAYCVVLDAWLLVDGDHLAIADQPSGQDRWLTTAERERSEKERERSEKERERSEKERERSEKERERAARMELERRVAELERLQRH
jgi:Uma2 family endonuclease